ncbi:MAG: ATP-dependent helicase HrpB [Deltaproteobacteria bacterium]|nr:ATP-dependent helicase HrpB [Deltaproteobacteria bacterium]
MLSLPIDSLLVDLSETLRRTRALVLEAPPGAGKTTRVPRALLDHGFAASGEIIVLQPRRLAARMAAQRVADELGEPVGQTIGYQVRYDDRSSSATRIRFVTEGILTRKLLSTQTLPGVSCVILDEFHERHIDGDLALAWLRHLQQTTRKDLALVVMSATLDAAPVAQYLDNCPRITSEGRRFDVAIEHLARADDRPLHEQVLSALKRLCSEKLDGDVLVFLPGSAEIRRCAESLSALASTENLLVLPLYGDLSPAEQDRAVRPADRRKVVLSTNVAETSVTIEGVVAVIDCGLARIASHAPWSGLPLLRLSRVSKASAIQRAGRAGRTRPGRCLRLYSQHDYDSRPVYDAPEIARLDLAQTMLTLRGSAGSPEQTLRWFEPPPVAARDAALLLLTRLGALDAQGVITDTGHAMLRFALHPRLARMVVEGERRGISQDACAMAALLAERDVRTREVDQGRFVERGDSDLTALLERFEHAAYGNDRTDRARSVGLDPSAVASALRAQQQAARTAHNLSKKPDNPTAYDHALRICALSGFVDRVARTRRPANHTGREGIELVFAHGGTAKLAPTSCVHDASWVVALDAEERNEGRHAGQVMVRTASAIEPDWLMELYTDQCEDREEARYDSASDRVVVDRKLTFGALVLEQRVERNPSATLVAQTLADAAIAKGIAYFVKDDAFDRLRARMRFVSRTFGAESMPMLDDDTLRTHLRDACVGLRSFEELRREDLPSRLLSGLTGAQRRLLDEAAPERTGLPGGRKCAIEYPQDAAPFIASRMQDFFGMADGPRIAQGRVAVVLHLLAPNQRAVQVTTDLAGFWERHYPAIAKELRRKYPRHPFPDDPRSATPPAPRR